MYSYGGIKTKCFIVVYSCNLEIQKIKRRRKNMMKAIITGIDISNSNLEKTTIIQKDDLVELYDDIGLLPNCHEDLKKHFIEMIREKYSELICRIVEQKDFTPTTKKIIYNFCHIYLMQT